MTYTNNCASDVISVDSSVANATEMITEPECRSGPPPEFAFRSEDEPESIF